ncbi:MAG TPA: hypothetical protein VJI66_01580, partial [Candidatus Paceibacterota bacterium]
SAKSKLAGSDLSIFFIVFLQCLLLFCGVQNVCGIAQDQTVKSGLFTTGIIHHITPICQPKFDPLENYAYV